MTLCINLEEEKHEGNRFLDHFKKMFFYLMKKYILIYISVFNSIVTFAGQNSTLDTNVSLESLLMSSS